MAAQNRNHRSLALLVCGKTTGKTLTENGDYIDIFQRYFQASLATVQGQKQSVEKPNHDPSSQPIWQFSLDPYDVVRAQEYPTDAKINDYHGVIITGSRACARLLCVVQRPLIRVASSSCFRLRERGLGQQAGCLCQGPC